MSLSINSIENDSRRLRFSSTCSTTTLNGAQSFNSWDNSIIHDETNAIKISNMENQANTTESTQTSNVTIPSSNATHLNSSIQGSFSTQQTFSSILQNSSTQQTFSSILHNSSTQQTFSSILQNPSILQNSSTRSSSSARRSFSTQQSASSARSTFTQSTSPLLQVNKANTVTYARLLSPKRIRSSVHGQAWLRDSIDTSSRTGSEHDISTPTSSNSKYKLLSGTSYSTCTTSQQTAMDSSSNGPISPQTAIDPTGTCRLGDPKSQPTMRSTTTTTTSPNNVTCTNKQDSSRPSKRSEIQNFREMLATVFYPFQPEIGAKSLLQKYQTKDNQSGETVHLSTQLDKGNQSGETVHLSTQLNKDNEAGERIHSPTQLNKSNEAGEKIHLPTQLNKGNEAGEKIHSPTQLNKGNEAGEKIHSPTRSDSEHRKEETIHPPTQSNKDKQNDDQSKIQTNDTLEENDDTSINKELNSFTTQHQSVSNLQCTSAELDAILDALLQASYREPQIKFNDYPFLPKSASRGCLPDVSRRFKRYIDSKELADTRKLYLQQLYRKGSDGIHSSYDMPHTRVQSNIPSVSNGRSMRSDMSNLKGSITNTPTKSDRMTSMTTSIGANTMTSNNTPEIWCSNDFPKAGRPTNTPEMWSPNNQSNTLTPNKTPDMWSPNISDMWSPNNSSDMWSPKRSSMKSNFPYTMNDNHILISRDNDQQTTHELNDIPLTESLLKARNWMSSQHASSFNVYDIFQNGNIVNDAPATRDSKLLAELYRLIGNDWIDTSDVSNDLALQFVYDSMDSTTRKIESTENLRQGDSVTSVQDEFLFNAHADTKTKFRDSISFQNESSSNKDTKTRMVGDSKLFQNESPFTTRTKMTTSRTNNTTQQQIQNHSLMDLFKDATTFIDRSLHNESDKELRNDSFTSYANFTPTMDSSRHRYTMQASTNHLIDSNRNYTDSSIKLSLNNVISKEKQKLQNIVSDTIPTDMLHQVYTTSIDSIYSKAALCIQMAWKRYRHTKCTLSTPRIVDRMEWRQYAIVLIQSVWRGYHVRQQSSKTQKRVHRQITLQHTKERKLFDIEKLQKRLNFQRKCALEEKKRHEALMSKITMKHQKSSKPNNSVTNSQPNTTPNQFSREHLDRAFSQLQGKFKQRKRRNQSIITIQSWIRMILAQIHWTKKHKQLHVHCSIVGNTLPTSLNDSFKLLHYFDQDDQMIKLSRRWIALNVMEALYSKDGSADLPYHDNYLHLLIFFNISSICDWFMNIYNALNEVKLQPNEYTIFHQTTIIRLNFLRQWCRYCTNKFITLFRMADLNSEGIIEEDDLVHLLHNFESDQDIQSSIEILVFAAGFRTVDHKLTQIEFCANLFQSESEDVFSILCGMFEDSRLTSPQTTLKYCLTSNFNELHDFLASKHDTSIKSSGIMFQQENMLATLKSQANNHHHEYDHNKALRTHIHPQCERNVGLQTNHHQHHKYVASHTKSARQHIPPPSRLPPPVPKLSQELDSSSLSSELYTSKYLPKSNVSSPGRMDQLLFEINELAYAQSSSGISVKGMLKELSLAEQIMNASVDEELKPATDTRVTSSPPAGERNWDKVSFTTTPVRSNSNIRSSTTSGLPLHMPSLSRRRSIAPPPGKPLIDSSDIGDFSQPFDDSTSLFADIIDATTVK